MELLGQIGKICSQKIFMSIEMCQVSAKGVSQVMLEASHLKGFSLEGSGLTDDCIFEIPKALKARKTGHLQSLNLRRN